ncbi:multicopper oxidase domain-containing protein [Candidatus Acetothermia bacterium]|nr:multicopper oxidase domain-containing protein [Candidatus Acetothermia bacterium]
MQRKKIVTMLVVATGLVILGAGVLGSLSNVWRPTDSSVVTSQQTAPQHQHDLASAGPMFMDFLNGGAQAAEAATKIGNMLPDSSNKKPLEPTRVFVRDGVTVREYTLEIVKKVIDYGNGATWEAWTFNGQVPGPTLRVKPGEILRVHVINKLDRVHSFHAHLSHVPQEMDGSQANIITGKGTGAMIPPGKEYTYEYQTGEQEFTYYHCHAGDEDYPINQHMLQGLYGAILVEDPQVRQEVLFMGESGPERKGDAPFFIMNGLGLPGGEQTLEKVFKAQGLQGVVGQLGKTVPFYKMKVGERMKLHITNIGNVIHSLHIHEIPLISLDVLNHRPWPAQVAPLVPGTADTLLIEFKNPGIWLFHCHVVSHADAGMIGAFIVE